MNPKYLEHIVVYLSVLVVCVLIGLLARMIVVSAGVDEFTATTVFWAVTALGVIVYAVLTLLIEGLFSSTLLKFFRKKAQLKITETTPIQTESLKEIRAKQQRQMDDKKRAKRDYAVEVHPKGICTLHIGCGFRTALPVRATVCRPTSIERHSVNPGKNPILFGFISFWLEYLEIPKCEQTRGHSPIP